MCVSTCVCVHLSTSITQYQCVCVCPILYHQPAFHEVPSEDEKRRVRSNLVKSTQKLPQTDFRSSKTRQVIFAHEKNALRFHHFRQKKNTNFPATKKHLQLISRIKIRRIRWCPRISPKVRRFVENFKSPHPFKLTVKNTCVSMSVNERARAPLKAL